MQVLGCLLLLCSCVSLCLGAGLEGARYQHVEEWKLWKGTHSKSYESSKEDMEKHIVWLSNKEYIEQHNKNAHIFGFTLAMNHLAMVQFCVSGELSLDLSVSQSGIHCF